jgi:hypothetical protein
MGMVHGRDVEANARRTAHVSKEAGAEAHTPAIFTGKQL